MSDRKPYIKDDKIHVPLSEQYREDGTTNFCSYERMRPALERLCGLRPGELLRGVTFDESGAHIRIGYKRQKGTEP